MFTVYLQGFVIKKCMKQKKKGKEPQQWVAFQVLEFFFICIIELSVKTGTKSLFYYVF